MKKLITITLILFASNIYSQSDNLFNQVDLFIAKCDSAKNDIRHKRCHIEYDKGKKTRIIKSEKYNSLKLDISVADLPNPIKLINYIVDKKYIYSSKPFVRLAALYILDRLFYANKLNNYDSYKQQLTLIGLKNILLGGKIISFGSIDSSCFTHEAKQKIADILDNKYRKEDIILSQLLRYRKMRVDSISNKGYYDYIKRKALKLNMTVREWEDSVNDARLKEAMQVDTSKIYFGNGVLAIIGNLKFKEFAPKLENLLNDKRYKRYHDDILLVLAKLEYKDYEQQFFKQLLNQEYKYLHGINYVIKKLRQVGTQNALFEISKFIDAPFEHYCSNPAHDKQPVFAYGYYLVYELCRYIENFPYDICCNRKEYTADGYLILYSDTFHNCFCSKLSKYPPNLLELAKEWMKENKGKYKISSDFKLRLWYYI